MKAILVLLLGAVVWWTAPGCATRAPTAVSTSEAQYEFKRIVREYQLPAAEATNDVDRAALLDQAANAFEALREKHPDASPWAAAALRSAGNIHAELGHRKEALAAYARVGLLYPDDEWEAIQAMRSAGDILWIAGIRDQAILFYREIIEKFDKPGKPPMFDTVVRIAKDRLSEAAPPP
ncbi:MAG TPA: hypothetical protein PKE12_10185 [Kiritimatiellia bacterium]|nr:hypothetical protein [Kiritimatiellia bacterium]